jgi:3-phosphoshikimate 1-carboxyvinyltransferase
MAFALAGLRIPNVVIRNPGCVSKTWPDYFAVLGDL